jgi:hypothetical protein
MYACHSAPENAKAQNLLTSFSFLQKIFFEGAGKVCAVVDIKNQTLPVHHPEQTYTCEGSSYLDDPYEGELFTWWLQFFGGLSEAEIEALWEYKRAKLVSVDYHMGKFGPITVQKGIIGFSAREKQDRD